MQERDGSRYKQRAGDITEMGWDSVALDQYAENGIQPFARQYEPGHDMTYIVTCHRFSF